MLAHGTQQASLMLAKSRNSETILDSLCHSALAE
jgi:hypothetical protein